MQSVGPMETGQGMGSVGNPRPHRDARAELGRLCRSCVCQSHLGLELDTQNGPDTPGPPQNQPPPCRSQDPVGGDSPRTLLRQTERERRGAG